MGSHTFSCHNISVLLLKHWSWSPNIAHFWCLSLIWHTHFEVLGGDQDLETLDYVVTKMCRGVQSCSWSLAPILIKHTCLIKVLITRSFLAAVLELNSAGCWTSRSRTGHSWFSGSYEKFRIYFLFKFCLACAWSEHFTCSTRGQHTPGGHWYWYQESNIKRSSNPQLLICHSLHIQSILNRILFE